MINQTIIPPSGEESPNGAFVYGSITARFLAMVVDWVIVFVLMFLLFVPLFILSLFGSLIAAPVLMLFDLTLIPSFFLMLVFVHWIYFATMESAERGATYGKRLLDLRVCDEAGNKLTFARASLRYVAKLVSAFPFLLGFVMALVTRRKQALHDLIAETIVIKN